MWVLSPEKIGFPFLILLTKVERASIRGRRTIQSAVTGLINWSFPSEKSIKTHDIKKPIHIAPLSPKKTFHFVENKPKLNNRNVDITEHNKTRLING